MTRSRTTLTLAASLATALAVTTSAAVAQKDGGGEDARQAEACKSFGCGNGNSECAKASAKELHFEPFGFGEFLPWIETIEWTCYEPRVDR